MEFFAVWSTKIFLQTERVPRWIFYMLSGSVASVVLGLLHRGDKTKTQRQALQKAKLAQEESKKQEELDKTAVKQDDEKKGSKGRSGGAKLRKQRK